MITILSKSYKSSFDAAGRSYLRAVKNDYIELTLDFKQETLAIATSDFNFQFYVTGYANPQEIIKDVKLKGAFKEFNVGDTVDITLTNGTTNNRTGKTITEKISNSIIRIGGETFTTYAETAAMINNKTKPNEIDFYYNIIDNLANANYISNIDGSAMRYKAVGLDAAVLTYADFAGLGNKSWQFGLSSEVTIAGLGAFGSGSSTATDQRFRIIQKLFFIPYVLDTDFEDVRAGVLEAYFKSGKLLKHVYKINTQTANLSNQTITDNSIVTNISLFTCGFGQTFKGIDNGYYLDSIVYKNTALESISALGIKYGDDTAFEIVVKNDSAPFVDGTTKFTFNFNNDNKTIDPTTDLIVNYLFCYTPQITIGDGAGGYGTPQSANLLFNTISAKFISTSEFTIKGTFHISSLGELDLILTSFRKYVISIIVQKSGLTDDNSDRVCLEIDTNDYYIDSTDNTLIDFVTEEPLYGVQYWYRQFLGVSTGNLFTMSHIMYLNQGDRDLSLIDFKSLKIGVFAEKEFLYIPYTNVLGSFQAGDIIGDAGFFGVIYTSILEDTGTVLKTYNYNTRDLDNYFEDTDTLSNYILETGIVTTSLAFTTVTGTGTKFTTELIVGALLYDYDNNFIGEVDTITDDFTLDLVANAAVAVTDSAHFATTRIITIDAPNSGDVYFEVEDSFSLDEVKRDLSLIQKANDLKNDNTTSISTVNIFDYRDYNIPDLIGGNNDPFKTISVKRRKDTDVVEISYENESGNFVVGDTITHDNSTVSLELIAIKQDPLVSDAGTYYLQGTNEDIGDWISGGVLDNGTETADATTKASMKYGFEVRMPIYDLFEYWKKQTTLTINAQNDFYDSTNPPVTGVTLGNQTGFNKEWYHYNQVAGWKVKYRVELTTNDRRFPEKSAVVNNTYNTQDRSINFNFHPTNGFVIGSGVFEEDGKLFDYNSNLKWGRKTLTTWRYDATNSPTFKGTSLLIGGTDYCLGGGKTVVQFTFDGRVWKLPYYQTTAGLVVGATITNTTLTQTAKIDSWDNDYIYITQSSGGTWALNDVLTSGTFVGQMSGDQIIFLLKPLGFTLANLSITLGIETFERNGSSEVNFVSYPNLGIIGEYWNAGIYSLIRTTDFITGYAIIDEKLLPANKKFRIHCFWNLSNVNAERGDHIYLDVTRLQPTPIFSDLNLGNDNIGQCCFQLQALATITTGGEFTADEQGNELMNDTHSFLFFANNNYTNIVMSLQKYIDGAWTDTAMPTLNNNTYGTYFSYSSWDGSGQKSDDDGNVYVGYLLEWKLVLRAVGLGEGLYRVKAVKTLLDATTEDEYSLQFNLLKYTTFRAKKTVYIETINKEIKGNWQLQNGLIDYGNYKDQWYNAWRLKGVFGFNSFTTQKEYTEYRLRNKEWVQDEQTPEYELRLPPIEGWLRNVIAMEICQADNIKITNYNNRSANTHLRTEVNFKGDFKPDYEQHNLSRLAMVTLGFEDKYNYRRNRRTFDGN